MSLVTLMFSIGARDTQARARVLFVNWLQSFQKERQGTMNEAERRLKRSNITVDFAAIAKGIYDMMPEEYKSALAFGMCPAPFMDMAEENFKRNIAEASIRKSGDEPTEEGISTCVKYLDKELVRAFNHLLALAMLNEAKRNGALVV